MFADSRKKDQRPQVGFAPVVLCPRIADAALHNASIPICISIESTTHIYNDDSKICAKCQNRSACKGRVDRMKDMKEVERPRRERVPLSMAEAQRMPM